MWKMTNLFKIIFPSTLYEIFAARLDSIYSLFPLHYRLQYFRFKVRTDLLVQWLTFMYLKKQKVLAKLGDYKHNKVIKW